MFEKEIEEKINILFSNDNFVLDKKGALQFALGIYHQYCDNKANEWHYPSKGEYPKDNSFVLVLTIEGVITTNYGEEYSDGIPENGLFQGIHISDVIAWKEIVLPELPKEIKE